MARELEISAAAGVITAEPAPILLLDSCAIIDIVRGPYRHASVQIDAGMALGSIASEPRRRLHLVAADKVPAECAEHITTEKENLRKHIRDAERFLSSLRDASAYLGLPILGSFDSARTDHFIERVVSVAEDLLDHAIILKLDDDCRNRAYERVDACRRPARKGGGHKDCRIVEHYLSLCNSLSALAFDRKIVLVSSNTKDFSDENDNSKLHPDLASDFTLYSDFAYATNLAWAKSKLGF